jgi:hypothetical protein
MATRAERFRASQERSGPKHPKKPARSARSQQVDVLAGVSPGDRPRGPNSTAARNLSLGKKAVYALEDSAAPKLPSRKSTRRSRGRQKAATQKKATVELALNSPRRRRQTRGS